MKDSIDKWPERLSKDYPARAHALDELRIVLLKGLQKGLSGRAGANILFIEDVVQEALLRILDKLHTFQGRSQFTSWALSIAFRMAFNELRRKEWNNVSLEELRERQAFQENSTDLSFAPDHETEQRELIELLRDVIKSDLTERQRDVLLCELSGMPQEEIAKQLGTNRNNLYKLFHDARKALRRALKSRGYNEEMLLGYRHKV
ncbi:MAG: RNA polymerase sigma factor [Calditrichia bacterium]